MTGDLTFNAATLHTTGDITTARQIVLNSGIGTFEVDAGTTLTSSGIVSGAGSVAKKGEGTLILTADNTYLGSTTVSAGTLQVDSSNQLGSDGNSLALFGGRLNTVGSFTNPRMVILVPSSIIDVAAGTTLTQTGNLRNIILQIPGSLNKQGGGDLILTGANSYTGATFVDAGTLSLTDGTSVGQSELFIGFSTGSDAITNVEGVSTHWDLSDRLLIGFDGTGRLNIANGAIVNVGDTANLGINGFEGILNLDGGTLDNAAGNGIVIAKGTLQGQGTLLGNLTNNDTVSPGNSAGVLTLTGDYTQDAAGTLAIEIGGSDNSDLQNPEFDLFDISGLATLEGELELALIDGFIPNPAEAFVFLSASSITGEFGNVADGERLNLTSGGSGSFHVDYTSDSVILSDFILFTADFDEDGDVDAADLTAWQSGYGTPSGALHTTGDANADGDVDGSDFLAWQQQYSDSGSAALTSQGVPEPATFSLCIVLALLCFVTQRKRFAI